MMRIATNFDPVAMLRRRSKDDRRRFGRLRCEDTVCCLGQVVDLSGAGMRVRRRGQKIVPLGYEGELEVRCGPMRLSLTGRCVRVEREGFRRWSYGIQFVNLTDEQRGQLVELARLSRSKLTLT